MSRANAHRSPEQAGAPNRPLRAISMLVLALAAAIAVHLEGIPLDVTTARQATRLHGQFSIGIGHLITVGGTIAFFVFALISTFAFARWARFVLERFIGAAYGAIVRYVMILLGICVVSLVTLSMLGFRVGQLVVGGAVTGVLITIAAQQSLSNVFAGVMLQFAHPFKVGDLVRIKAGSLGGTVEGTVAEFSITYVRLETGDGPVLLPNAQVITAAVSPVRPTEATDDVACGQDAAATTQGMAAIAEGIAALAKDMAVAAQETGTWPGSRSATTGRADGDLGDAHQAHGAGGRPPDGQPQDTQNPGGGQP
jgi:hypothetical protein